MRNDVGSNYSITQVINTADGAAAFDSASVDHSAASSVTFAVAGADAAVLDVKLQYSDDNIAWTDEPDDEAGNTIAIALLDADGLGQVHVPNPRGRYSRVTTSAGPVVVLAVLGPLRHVSV